ncbi:site-specific DNA-methyltransferase [Candidatus Poribacteria bacterium]|nr:site-specific DNA-methyltransferase [Candidatus Poribacteria bacterium]MYH79612.1 site-specific DNA-methyltransferase [Candidatus Poribacteria bacterium]MYK92805.1 site-specific DNA-methyltransferase [Candidatus Poribacteria bacterium]
MKNRNLEAQFTLFPIDNEFEVPKEETTSDGAELVSFRDLVPEINDTGYLTHAIFAYPAKFIPQIVRYAINTYTKEGDWIVDPFAGSGTVGVEAYLCKRNAILFDLNLLLNHIMPLKVYDSKERLAEADLHKLLEGMRESKHQFMPVWSNVAYWYAPEMLDVLSQYWGFIHNTDNTVYSTVIKAALLKASKRFSYTEDRTPKLARSKRKLQAIGELLKENWKEQLDDMIHSLSLKTLRSLNDFVVYTQQNCFEHSGQVEFRGGVDSSYVAVPRACDALITSPPYLQAQEYIRSTKMELFWLGHTEEEVKELSRLEIPYRKADRIIQTETLDKVREMLTRDDLQKRLDSYFCHTVNALENSMRQLKLNAAACIFVGNPRIDGITVEIWRILAEYFVERGFAFEKVYEDRIKTRKLFGARKNKNPDGMKSEFLLILRKSAICQTSALPREPLLQDAADPLPAPKMSPDSDAS